MFYLLALVGGIGVYLWLKSRPSFQNHARLEVLSGENAQPVLPEKTAIPLVQSDFRRQVMKAQFLENVGVVGERLAQQLVRTEDMMKKFMQILKQKFTASEITFHRYQAGAEQAFQVIFDNLVKASQILLAAESENPKELQKNIVRLEGLKVEGGVREPFQEKELNSLLERRARQELHIMSVNEILSGNEEAINQLDRLTMTLALVKVDSNLSGSVHLNAALEELKDLSARLKKYSLEENSNG